MKPKVSKERRIERLRKEIVRLNAQVERLYKSIEAIANEKE